MDAIKLSTCWSLIMGTSKEDIDRKKEEIENILKQICPIHRALLKEEKNEDGNLDVNVQSGESSQEEPSQRRKRKSTL